MAHVQKLPDDALDAIAKQVGRLYPSLDNNVTQRQPSAELTETFPVWFLSIEAINTDNDNLLELAQDTLRWHSQMSIDGKPEGVVRTMASSGDTADWTVRQILKGDFAKTVDDAIRWIDAEITTDPLVRILEIPAFFITALWLIDGEESSVVIAKLPEHLQSLSPLVRYSSQDFLEVLRQEPHTIGIRPQPLQPPRQDRQSTSKRNTFNVLSIDTGIDGIIPAMVLAKIEEETGLPTADNFDLIAGTSAGGSLALGLSAKDDEGKPQYKASELVDIYQTWRNEFFSHSPGYVWSVRKSLISTVEDPLTQEDELSENPQNVLMTYFRKATLGNVLEKTKTMITYYDSEANAPFSLKSWEPGHTAVEMWRAAWVTSAAFTHFKPSPFPIGSKVRTLVDGGVFVNSPVVSAYEEAKKIISEEETFEHFEDSDIFVLWLGSRATIGYQNLSSLGDNYVRLYPSLSEVGAHISNASRGDITNFRNLADKLIKSTEFHKACSQLMLPT
ncbi:MAG: patatin-like phospholipase family protein [Candidatus Poribacteria bacterium]|nr:patatin-like phospholipase family protein [Candidatus Poribacteria bacterium]